MFAYLEHLYFNFKDFFTEQTNYQLVNISKRGPRKKHTEAAARVGSRRARNNIEHTVKSHIYQNHPLLLETPPPKKYLE